MGASLESSSSIPHFSEQLILILGTHTPRLMCRIGPQQDVLKRVVLHDVVSHKNISEPIFAFVPQPRAPLRQSLPKRMFQLRKVILPK